MKPKEKAQELVNKYHPYIMKYDIYLNRARGGMIVMKEAKECALIAVDEVIENIEDDYMGTDMKYWEEVKNEIKKL